MISSIFPLRAIVFQFLFLLVAIAIEGYIFHQRLRLDQRTSIQYAITVNLLSVVVGWLIFFAITPFIPNPWKAQLISYIFFGQFYFDAWSGSIPSVVVTIVFVMFFLTLLLKLQGLNWLERLLGKTPEDRQEKRTHERTTGRNQKRIFFQGTGTRAAVVLLANACSFSAILLLLLIRLLDRI